MVGTCCQSFSFSLPWPTGRFSLVSAMSVCVKTMYVISDNKRNQESWRLLVKEHIGNIRKLKTPFVFKCLDDFWRVQYFLFQGLCEPAYCAGLGPVAVGT